MFHGLFPNAVILGYRKSAPIDGAKVRNVFHEKMMAITRPLLLDQEPNVNAIIGAWRETIESVHAGHTAQKPGYLQNGVVHDWDGAAWQTVAPLHEGNECKRKGDFSGSFPGPPP